MDSDRGAVHLVLEWRGTGHRLGYVAALAHSARSQHLRLHLLTDRETASRPEFDAHLGSVDLVVHFSGARMNSFRSRIRSLRLPSLPCVDHLIVPEADTEILFILAALLARRLPQRTTTIFMRPSRTHAPRGLLKTLGMALLRALGVRILLLEDPLGGEKAPVWPAIARRLGAPVFDPVNLTRTDNPTIPPELGIVDGSHQIVSMVGSIDSRKRPIEVLRAWSLARREDRGALCLVFAGRVSADVRADGFLQAAANDEDTIVIDRYLTNDEFQGIVVASSATFALQSEPFSSGTLIVAAQAGVPIIAAEGTRIGSVVRSENLGLSSLTDPTALARAIARAVEMRANLQPRQLQPEDFGRTVLG